MTDIQTIMQQMTLQEKAALCSGDSAWTTTPLARLGIPAMRVSDGPHGLRRVAARIALNAPSLPATCFPTASCLASTWDTDLLRAVGQALGEECIALDVDVLLGPGINMKRTPLCGRNFEYYSEDPYLAGELAASFVSGVQSQGAGTSLKHFAANNQEFQRNTISAEVDERTLREIYLAAFEAVVKKAKPWTVMCAYNRLNGTYCSEHHRLLVDILKNEWGFEGLVVSDWGAVHDRVAALKGGLDLEMPGPQEQRVAAVVAAVQSGQLPEAVLDESVRRILGIVFKAAARPKGGEFDQEGHHRLARQAAAEGMVLLKNNGVLPLKNRQRVAVIGRAAKQPHFQGGGSSRVNPTKVDIPVDELQELAGSAQLVYAEGYPSDGSFQPALIDEAARTARAADVALIFTALPDDDDNEGNDRADLELTRQQVALIKAVSAAQPQTVVILNGGSAVAMSDWMDGVAAVLEAWLTGQAGGGAIADVLFGRVNPSGRLAETFPLRLADTPAHLNFPGGAGEVRYGEGVFIGYRYYDAKQMPVLFPFGYGLSYTTFAYQSPRVSATTFKDVDGLSVSVAVTNTGTVAGKEVIQIYVHDHKSKLVRPPKELKGFAKVELQPGGTKTVTIPLDFRAFAYYHPAYQQWITEDGEFDILIAASAADIRFTQTVTLQSTAQLPCLLDRDSTIREWLDDPRGRAVIDPLFQGLRAQLAHAFGDGGAGETSAGEAAGTDSMGFIMDTPLLSLLEFQEKMAPMPMPAAEQVDGLLRQVHGSDGRHD
jgi:beta-glucosidase